MDQQVGCDILSVNGPATFDGTQCCYPVTERCSAVTGRPYLVAGRSRTANARPAVDAGWRADMNPRVDALPDEARAALRDGWLRDALGEHASVASFARMSLELLAMGAPADLVDDAHRAASDEVRHARLCFGLASAYAGYEIAPGSFPFDGAVAIDGDVARFAARCVIEGCIGETLAAIRASEQLAAASDPAVAAVLEQIATDEARHAELAWRAVAWAMCAGGEPVHAAVAAAFDEAAHVAASSREVSIHLADVMAAHGRAAETRMVEALERAVREVVLPAAAALLETRRDRGSPASTLPVERART